MAGRGKYNDHTYRKRRAAQRRREEALDLPCYLCGNPIDWTAPAGEPLSWTYDHEDPLSLGGKLLGKGRGAHHSCNSRRGAGKDHLIVTKPKRTSRDWYA